MIPTKKTIDWREFFRQRMREGDFGSQAEYVGWLANEIGTPLSLRTFQNFFQGRRTPSAKFRELICDAHSIQGADREIIMRG